MPWKTRRRESRRFWKNANRVGRDADARRSPRRSGGCLAPAGQHRDRPRAVDVRLAGTGIRFKSYEILFEQFAATCLIFLIGLKNLPYHQPVSEDQELFGCLGTVEM